HAQPCAMEPGKETGETPGRRMRRRWRSGRGSPAAQAPTKIRRLQVTHRLDGAYQPELECQVLPGLGSVAVAVTVVPSMSQTCGVPSPFWNWMSALPSPLKSSVPIICQVAPGPAVVVDETIDVPFIS